LRRRWTEKFFVQADKKTLTQLFDDGSLGNGGTVRNERSSFQEEEMSEASPRSYGPGDTAIVSGIYVVIHSRGCQASHSVTIVQGEILPSCLGCSGEVRFEPAISAVHVREHPLFRSYS
jgi:hypothetical protein